MALTATLASCATSRHTSSFPPPPKPPRPGQVVIIAGDTTVHRPPRDGEYAVRTSAYSDGGLTADGRTGAVYYTVAGEDGQVIARIERNGTISTLPIGIGADQLYAANGHLWMMVSYAGIHLAEVSMATLKRTDVLGSAREVNPHLKVLGRSGERAELDDSWRGSLFTLRGDGVPILISGNGRLFEVVGRNTLRRWRPQGYREALQRALRSSTTFRPTSLVPDGRGGVIALGASGVLRIGDDGTAHGFAFPASARKLPPWTAMAPLRDGSILLLGGVSAMQERPRPTLLRPDGGLDPLSFGPQKKCDDFDGSMATVASADPGGIAALGGDAYVMSDSVCGVIYSFRLPLLRAGHFPPR